MPKPTLLAYVEALYEAHAALREGTDGPAMACAADALRRHAPGHDLVRALDEAVRRARTIEALRPRREVSDAVAARPRPPARRT